ncbi:MAG: undecaprenyl-diphosphate phosphatase [Microbacteriaceae bacterium]|nr:undecaprenyl-diphosphate phosphatase [Microbacteriaceae bacterium]
MGAIQGISELFPVSSLAHSILIPAVIGGSWAKNMSVSTPESPYLAFIVGLHVATALALLLFFRREWISIIGGFFVSVRTRSITTGPQRTAWLLIVGTIPVGLAGLLLEHTFRTVFGQPQVTAIFLSLNGIVLFAGDRFRRRTNAVTPESAADQTNSHATGGETSGDSAVSRLSYRRGLAIGSTQVLALLPGISRSGIAILGGMAAGLTHREAARFSFLLATPVILAAGLLKLPDLFGPLGAGIQGQVLAGSAASFICAFVAVAFLDRYFRTRTLTPFALYCIAAGVISFLWISFR